MSCRKLGERRPGRGSETGQVKYTAAVVYISQ